MSFYPQPDSYRCGPFALKYALAMLGIFKHEDTIAAIAGSNWWAGTDEIGLARAAKHSGVRLKYLQSSNPNDARRMINEQLAKKRPLLLCVKDWEHWCTVVSYSKGKYILIDSEWDKVILIRSSDQLVRYWRFKDYYEGVISYDAYAVIPQNTLYTRAKFTPAKAELLMSRKYDSLSKKWDVYVNDLFSITRPRTALTVNMISFSEFLRRNQHNLVEQVANWHGDPSYAEIENVLDNMRFVADIYDLIIPDDEEKRALIDVTSLLMMYACGKYGMNPIY